MAGVAPSATVALRRHGLLRWFLVTAGEGRARGRFGSALQVSLLLAFPLVPRSVGAQTAAQTPTPTSTAGTTPRSGYQTSLGERSELERSVAEEALVRYGYEIDDAPEGKEIESIEVYVLPVFDERDPIPDFVNALHAPTRDWIVRQEVLAVPGDRWEIGRILETERNLRGLRQISLANVVAARGSTADKVRLVVVVKDVWSLRINTNFAVGGDGLENLLVNPAEENLAGLHMNVGLLYLLQRDRQAFGARVIYPRIAGSRFWTALDASVFTNRDTGQAEGTAGSFLYALPLYSRHRHFAFGTETAFLFETTRRYLGSEVRSFDYERADGSIESIPETYQTERLAADYWFVRSFGVRYKYDLSFGLELDHRRYAAPDLSGYSPAAAAAFEEEVLPVSDRRISPYAQIRSYETRYHRVLDLEILGLQEDHRMGHDVLLRTYAGSMAFGSTRDHLGVVAGLGYALPLGDGLLRAVTFSDIVLANDAKNEGYLAAQARIASPTALLGRLHFDVVVAHRYLNYLNVAPFSLGGNGRLRGYSFDEFQGSDLLAMNLEFRTKHIDVLSAQVGLAAFLDAGDAPASLDRTMLKVGTGVGLRILFPQAERRVLRIDWGLPVSGDRDVFPGTFFATFGQAFGMPAIGTTSVTRGLSLF